MTLQREINAGCPQHDAPRKTTEAFEHSIGTGPLITGLFKGKALVTKAFTEHLEMPVETVGFTTTHRKTCGHLSRDPDATGHHSIAVETQPTGSFHGGGGRRSDAKRTDVHSNPSLTEKQPRGQKTGTKNGALEAFLEIRLIQSGLMIGCITDVIR